METIRTIKLLHRETLMGVMRTEMYTAPGRKYRDKGTITLFFEVSSTANEEKEWFANVTFATSSVLIITSILDTKNIQFSKTAIKTR